MSFHSWIFVCLNRHGICTFLHSYHICLTLIGSVPSSSAMGSAASMTASRAGAWEKGIGHAQRVTRLYRASLRTARDWVIDYDLWIEECIKIQARFKGNKHKSLTEGKYLLEQGMAELMKKRHPEPYIPNYAPGGSKYQRNVPPPPEVRSRFFVSRPSQRTLKIYPLYAILTRFLSVYAFGVMGPIYVSLPASFRRLSRSPCRRLMNVFSKRRLSR